MHPQRGQIDRGTRHKAEVEMDGEDERAWLFIKTVGPLRWKSPVILVQEEW
jgi:hypothetical protein